MSMFTAIIAFTAYSTSEQVIIGFRGMHVIRLSIDNPPIEN